MWACGLCWKWAFQPAQVDAAFGCLYYVIAVRRISLSMMQFRIYAALLCPCVGVRAYVHLCYVWAEEWGEKDNMFLGFLWLLVPSRQICLSP